MAGTPDDRLGGLACRCGNRIPARAGFFHGPKHGGRHPWML